MKENGQRRWPIQFLSLSSLTALATPISVIGIGIFVASLIVAILALGWLLADLVSGDQRRGSDAARTALPILAGAIGLPLIIWRLLILDRQTRISEEKTQIDRETHYTSIFSRGIDQLGQTREIKRTVNSIDTIRTAPNIEVRLGGIHSLARLAEESVRDQRKIENILRSYVRENSWSDRVGEIIDKPDWPRNRVWDWAYYLDDDPSNSEAKGARDAWIEETKNMQSRLTEWAAQISETRVDVNEAADALSASHFTSTSRTKEIFYECLFVGRHFRKDLVALVNFRRCTFIKCTFDAQDQEFELYDCNVINAAFRASTETIKIENCRLLSATFQVQKGNVTLNRCEIYSSHFSCGTSHLRLANSMLYRVTVVGARQNEGNRATTHIDFFESVMVNGSLRNLALSSESDLNFAVSPDARFSRVDLSAVTAIGDEALRNVKADSQTIHPTQLARPSSWPKYGEEEDDDIPF